MRPLSDAEKQMLEDTYRYAGKRALRRRAHAILLSHQGNTVDHIAEILGVRRNAVSMWLMKWEHHGLPGLIDKSRSGRPPILDEQDRERVQELIKEHPHQLRELQITRLRHFQPDFALKSVPTV